MTRVVNPDFEDKVKKGYEKDLFFQEILMHLQSKEESKIPSKAIASIIHLYQLENGLLYYCRDGERRLCIPRDNSILELLITEAHDTPFGGHRNALRTYKHMAQSFYWPKMNNFIMNRVSSCDSCQRNKISSHAQKNFLHPLQIPNRPWQSVSMDFIVSLPKSSGFDSITVYVDRLSKQLHLSPCLSTIDAPSTASLFVRDVVRLHGVPSEIVSDRDPKFTSKFWKSLFALLKTKLSMSTAAHPESDGQTERMNRTIEVMIRHFVNSQLDNWAEMLPLLEFSINSTIGPTGKTPFEIVYGFNPPNLLDLSANQPSSTVLSLEELQGLWVEVRDSINDSQTIQAKYANQNRSPPPNFNIDDFVLLSTKHFTTKFRAKNAHKFQAPYIGPFKILAKISDVAYRLDLPASFKIHNVFYSGLLKPYKGEYNQPTPPEPVLLADNSIGYIVESILRRRKIRNSFQYLVKWKDYPEYESSWEPRKNLMKDVPDLVEAFDKAHPM
jgi:hypothetical protein